MKAQNDDVKNAYRLFYNSRKEYLKKLYGTISEMDFVRQSAKIEIIKALKVELEAVRNKINELQEENMVAVSIVAVAFLGIVATVLAIKRK